MSSRSATLAPRRQRAARPGRRAQRLAALAALLALAAAVLAACGGSKPQPPAVAARVNGVAIPRSEVTRLEKVGTLTGQPVTEKVAVEQLVAEELIRQQAKRLGTSVLDPAVQQRLNEYVKQVGGQATLDVYFRAKEFCTQTRNCATVFWRGLGHAPLQDMNCADTLIGSPLYRVYGPVAARP